MALHQISATEFTELYRDGKLNQTKIIDVREPYEWEMYHLDQALHIPMNTIPVHLDRLDQEEELYIICAHGVRSWHVVSYLVQQGYSKAINVEGGMAEVQLILDAEREK